MRAVIQRVKRSDVSVRGAALGEIGEGLLIFLGIEHSDEPSDVQWLVKKIIAMRIFADLEGKMNKSIVDTGGEVLVVSQFTLHASTKKGNRPSFIKAARPEVAIPLYEEFVRLIEEKLSTDRVVTGEFGANMQVGILNDGPVTIIIDSQKKE